MPSSPFRISISSNAQQYATTMRIRAAALTKTCEATGEELGKIAMERAEWWSSGPYKQRELTRMGHPYARRAPFAIGEGYASRINVQTGDFRGKWRWEHMRKVGTGDMVGSLTNASAHARWLTAVGTSRMVPRRVREAIAKDVRTAAQHLYGRIFPEVIRPRGTTRTDLSAAFQRGYARGVGGGPGGAFGRGLSSGFMAGFGG